jgi:hypothetical protein
MAEARSFEVIFLIDVVDATTQPTLTAAGLLPQDHGSFYAKKPRHGGRGKTHEERQRASNR